MGQHTGRLASILSYKGYQLANILVILQLLLETEKILNHAKRLVFYESQKWMQTQVFTRMEGKHIHTFNLPVLLSLPVLSKELMGY